MKDQTFSKQWNKVKHLKTDSIHIEKSKKQWKRGIYQIEDPQHPGQVIPPIVLSLSEFSHALHQGLFHSDDKKQSVN